MINSEEIQSHLWQLNQMRLSFGAGGWYIVIWQNNECLLPSSSAAKGQNESWLLFWHFTYEAGGSFVHFYRSKIGHQRMFGTTLGIYFPFLPWVRLSPAPHFPPVEECQDALTGCALLHAGPIRLEKGPYWWFKTRLARKLQGTCKNKSKQEKKQKKTQKPFWLP